MLEGLVEIAERQLVAGLVWVQQTGAEIKRILNFSAVIGVIEELRTIPIPPPFRTSRHSI